MSQLEIGPKPRIIEWGEPSNIGSVVHHTEELWLGNKSVKGLVVIR